MERIREKVRLWLRSISYLSRGNNIVAEELPHVSGLPRNMGHPTPGAHCAKPTPPGQNGVTLAAVVPRRRSHFLEQELLDEQDWQ